MTVVVVDANFSLAQVLPLPYSKDVVRRMDIWQSERPRILVPSLWEYEVVTGLRRACVQGLFRADAVQESLNELLGMALQVLEATAERHRRALEWAERLGQARAYDAQYLALAEQIEAELAMGILEYTRAEVIASY